MLGDRPAVLAREVTKIHEEFLRGHVSQLLAEATERNLKGEITLLVGPPDETARKKPAAGKNSSVLVRVERLQKKKKLSQKAALKEAAKELGLTRSEAYRRWQEEKALKR